ncbi:MAG: hypothetical protein RR645_04045 [Clostridium sp.]
MDNVNATNDTKTIKVYNGAGYIAIFTVLYYADGVSHFIQSPRFSLFFSESISIPSNATKIHVRVWYYLDIRTWVPFYDEDISTADDVCYSLYGTIYNPGCAKVPCDGDNLSTTPPPISSDQHDYYDCVDNGSEFICTNDSKYHCPQRPHPHCCKCPKKCCCPRCHNK